MITFAQLCKTNLDLNSINRISLLYAGGDLIRDRAHFFIKKHPNESQRMYFNRLGHFNYTNHFAHIIDSVVAATFEDIVNISSDDENIKKIVDANDFNHLLKNLETNTLVFGQAFCKRDLETNKFEIINNENVINYNSDHTEIIIRTIEEDKSIPIYVDDRFYFKIEHYRKIDLTLTIYTTKLTDLKSCEKISYNNWSLQNHQIELCEKYQLSEYPIYQFDLGKNLKFGQALILQAEKILRLESGIDAATGLCLNPIPVLYSGNDYERGVMNDAVDSIGRKRSPLDSFREAGVTIVTSGDKFEYLEPSGRMIDIAKTIRKDDIDDMYRLAYQTSQSIAAATSIGRSGASKNVDNMEKNIIISTIATSLKLFVIKFITELLNNAEAEYTINGLDFSSDGLDRVDLMTELNQFGLTQDLFSSKTLKKLYLQNAAAQLLEGMVESCDIKQINEELSELEVEENELEKTEEKTEEETDIEAN